MLTRILSGKNCTLPLRSNICYRLYFLKNKTLLETGIQYIDRILNHNQYKDIIDEDLDHQKYRVVHLILRRFDYEKTGLYQQLNSLKTWDSLKAMSCMSQENTTLSTFIHFFETHWISYQHFRNISSDCLLSLLHLIATCSSLFQMALQELSKWKKSHKLELPSCLKEYEQFLIGKKVFLSELQAHTIDACLLRLMVASYSQQITDDDVGNCINILLNHLPSTALLHKTIPSAENHSFATSLLHSFAHFFKVHLVLFPFENLSTPPNQVIEYHTSMQISTFNHMLYAIQKYGNKMQKQQLIELSWYHPVGFNQTHLSVKIAHCNYSFLIPKSLEKYIPSRAWWCSQWIWEKLYQSRLKFLIEQQARLAQCSLIYKTFSSGPILSDSIALQKINRYQQWIQTLCNAYHLIMIPLPKLAWWQWSYERSWQHQWRKYYMDSAVMIMDQLNNWLKHFAEKLKHYANLLYDPQFYHQIRALIELVTIPSFDNYSLLINPDSKEMTDLRELIQPYSPNMNQTTSGYSTKTASFITDLLQVIHKPEHSQEFEAPGLFEVIATTKDPLTLHNELTGNPFLKKDRPLFFLNKKPHSLSDEINHILKNYPKKTLLEEKMRPTQSLR